LSGRGTIRKRGTTGDAGGEREGEEGGVAAGVGIEQGEVTEGDMSGPEPGEWCGGDVGEQKNEWRGRRRRWDRWDR